MAPCSLSVANRTLLLLFLLLFSPLLEPAPAVVGEISHPDLQGLQEGLELLAEGKAKKAAQAFEEAEADSVRLADMLSHLARAYHREESGKRTRADSNAELVHGELSQALRAGKAAAPTRGEFEALLAWTRPQLEPAGKKGKAPPLVRILHCHLLLMGGLSDTEDTPDEEEDEEEEQGKQGSSERDVEPPVRLFSPGPLFTPAARAHGTEGTVILLSTIDRQGCPGKAELRQGLPHDLNHNAIAAVRWWVFEPARLDGQPVSVFYYLTTKFSLVRPGN